MSPAGTELKASPYEPRRPLLAAFGVLALWVVVLSLPMLAGKWLAGPVSDQYATGYAFRDWSAAYIKSHGAIPLWNPMMFGGLPYLGALHGDIFYITSWLRLVLPTDTVMNLGFVLHYLAAAIFTYVLLRMLGVTWVGAVVGGMAYHLSGVIGSYPAPGHDGKLFVTALLPLALIALVLAIRRNRFEGYALLALTVGLGLLSPHPQMLYYMLVAAGLFTLYLVFGEQEPRAAGSVASKLGLALVAVIVGFGIGMVEVLPFYEYLPFSPRAESYYGFQQAASYAVAWSHVPELFFSGFTGTSQAGTYWAANPLKLHSEYLGLSVIALAALGVGARDRRRLVLWLAVVGVLFLLVALGAGTPFYRLWWDVMPFMKKVRAPGMALYVVALVVAVYAALGAERLARGEGRQYALVWLIAGAVVALLAVTGVIGSFAAGVASTIGAPGGGNAVQIADRAAPAIRNGAVLSGLALLAVGGIAMLWLRGKVPGAAMALLLPLVVGADLWSNARHFWVYSEASDLYAPDSVTQYLQSQPQPYRVLDLGVYQGGGFNQNAILMDHSIPQLLGHHGNELHRFDELMGGKNVWRNLMSPAIWDLYAIEDVLVPAGAPVGQLPWFGEQYDSVMAGVPTTLGVSADVYRRHEPASYARLVPGAIKAPDDQGIPIIANNASGFDPDRVVLLAPDAPVEPARLSALPAALDVSARFESWEPGRMRVRLEPAAPTDAYLVLAENWYPEWEATVDGAPGTVLRGNVSMLTVPVSAGTREVEVVYRSAAYTRGKWLTFASLLLVLAGFVTPAILRRRKVLG